MNNNITNKDQTATALNAETTQKFSSDTGVKSYGKFKDAESLLNAYNSLQSEFTRRCQRVKELERMLGEVKNNELLTPLPNSLEDNLSSEKPSDFSAEFDNKDTQFSGEQSSSFNSVSADLKREIIREYLNTVKNSKPELPLMSGNGTAIIAPSSKPKNLAEAGELARQILFNKEIY